MGNEQKIIAVDFSTNTNDEGYSTGSNNGKLLDIAQLRLSQDFTESVGVKKALITVPVRKPNKQVFIRVNPDPGMCLQTAMLEMKEDREVYLVSRDLWSELAGEIMPVALYTAITKQNDLFLWPVKLPLSDGRFCQWHASALEAVNLAKTRWVRLMANMSLGAYDIREAPGNFPEPEWPDYSFQEIIDRAFKGHYIDSMEHIVIKRLRGEV